MSFEVTNHSITLNFPYDLSDEDWSKVEAVYQSIDGYIAPKEGCVPSWYGTENDTKHICVSVEPSGLLCEGNIETGIWVGWLTIICSRLSLALNREVIDVEM